MHLHIEQRFFVLLYLFTLTLFLVVFVFLFFHNVFSLNLISLWRLYSISYAMAEAMAKNVHGLIDKTGKGFKTMSSLYSFQGVVQESMIRPIVN